MALAQKQTHRSMEQNGETIDKFAYIWSINIQQRRQEYTMGGKTASSRNGVRKTGQIYAKESNWTTFSHHIK